MTLQNEKFEELIADHLKAALDGQRGKALAAFRRDVADGTATGDGTRRVPATLPATVSRRAMWWWAGVPSAVAAGLAVVVMVQLGVIGRRPVEVQQPLPGGVVVSTVEVMQNRTGGIVVNDNKPMRELRQETVRLRQWTDPQDNAVYTVTEPTVKVDYVQVQPN